MVRVPHVGLVNLIAGERVAPELIQDDATPAALARAMIPLIR
jgi:lipid-A-disaccharide synthase